MNVLITGTSQGIGKALVRRLCSDHAIYTINRTRSADSSIVKEIICDLSDIDQVKSVCKLVSQLNIDVLINNAGGSTPCDFLDLTIEDINKRMVLNYTAPALLIQSVLTGMIEKEQGCIINMSSVTAKTPAQFLTIYSSAKAALNSLTQNLAGQYGGKGITINAICPGSVDTKTAVRERKKISALHNMKEDDYQNLMLESNGLGRMVDVYDVVSVVVFLINNNGAINGQCINVCGTMEIH